MRGPLLAQRILRWIPIVRIEVVMSVHDLREILEVVVKPSPFRIIAPMGQVQVSTNHNIPAENKLSRSRELNLVRSHLPACGVRNTSPSQRHRYSLMPKADSEYIDPWILKDHFRNECEHRWSPSQRCIIGRSSFVAEMRISLGPIGEFRYPTPYSCQISI